MPKPGSSAKRYAQAAFEIAGDNLQQWQADLNALADALDNAEFASLMENPRVPTTVKRDTLRQVLPSVSEQVLNLASLLVAKGRLKTLARGIAESFGKMMDNRQGILRVEVVTAVPLTPEEERRIAEQLGSVTRRSVQLKSRVDPSLIGGMVVRLGDRVLDGSVRSKLNGLRQTLVG